MLTLCPAAWRKVASASHRRWRLHAAETAEPF
jgi:hypothetical protein